MVNSMPLKSDTLVIFKIENQEYGLDINIVREIGNFSQITKIPKSSPFILGIINLRGLVIPVIDPRKQFGITESVPSNSSRMIVLEHESVMTSMVIDSVSEVKKISEKSIEPPPAIINGIDSQFIRGIVKLEEGKRVILLLNIDEITKTEQKNKCQSSTMKTGNILEKKKEKKIEEEKLVIFSVAKESYAFSINNIREILRVPMLTKVPNSTDSVIGILTLRDSILPVFDFRQLIGIGSLEEEYIKELNKLEKEHSDLVNSLRKCIENDTEIRDINDSNLCSLTKWIDSFHMSSVIITEQVGKFKIPHDALHTKVASLVALVKKDKKGALEYFNTDVIESWNALQRVFMDVKKVIKENINEDQKILVIESGDTLAGLLVDHVDEVLNIDKSTIDATSISSDSSEVELKGIAKINNGEKLIFIMDENLFFKEQQKKIIAKLNNQKNIKPEKEKVTMSNDGSDAKDTEKFVTFSVAEEVYGIKIMQIKEINRITKITRVPKSPSFIEGVINLRGEVIPLIDVRKKFEIESKKRDDRTRILIADITGKKTGLIVDKVNEVINIAKNQIEPSPDIVSSNMSVQFLEGVAKLQEDKMVLLIDVNKILSPKENQEYKNLETKQNSNTKVLGESVETKELKIEE